MVFPVLILIHWGMGLFCFPFLASLDLMRKVLRADMMKLNLILKTLESYKLSMLWFRYEYSCNIIF